MYMDRLPAMGLVFILPLLLVVGLCSSPTHGGTLDACMMVLLSEEFHTTCSTLGHNHTRPCLVQSDDDVWALKRAKVVRRRMSVPRNKICAAGSETGEADCVSVHLTCNPQQNWQWAEWTGTSPNIARKFTITEGNTNRLCPYEERYFKPEPPTDCLDALKLGLLTSGVYTITPDGSTEMDVYCDQQLEGGGWTVIQLRQDAQVDFYRTWSEYKMGFGDVAANHWLGNDNFHLLTKGQNHEAMFRLKYADGIWGSARYSEIWVGDENEKYGLHIAGFVGAIEGAQPINAEFNAGDSMAFHNGGKFSTKDNDNDEYPGGSCSREWLGGWWFKRCLRAHLNGNYANTNFHGLLWNAWNGLKQSMVYTAMMVRRKTTEETYLDCLDAYNKGMTTSGVYTLKHDGIPMVKVYCEMELDGGGWTVLQRRLDGVWDFLRDWRDYKRGFGDLAADHWIGNDYIHLLTQNQDQKVKFRLGRLDGVLASADYSTFWVEDESQKYRLHIGGYSGTNVPGEAMMHNSNGQMFSTRDQDNDQSGGSCAVAYQGAWWFKSCCNAHLNGNYRNGPRTASGLLKINWHVYANPDIIYTAIMVKKNSP